MSGQLNKNTAVSFSEVIKQREYTEKIKVILSARFPGRILKAYVYTYGCQENVADSELIKGQLSEMGYTFTENKEEADFVLFNTCAVREHAENRIFGNVGALKPLKALNGDMIIALCGCMMQQKHIAERIKISYPYVNLVFGTFALHRLPELFYSVLRDGKRVFETEETDGEIIEGFPLYRDLTFKAWLPIMYGCNNFCSYCIVPYVRGRERSRAPQAVIEEAKNLIANGAKEITLLGQNVNSYDSGGVYGVSFARLLKMINGLDGDFKLHFMTSHPKDCTKELLDTMAECEKVARRLHLPVQSGSNRILKAMNRNYTRERYLELIEYARSVMPDISVTSDIIVGFPGETRDDFCDTLSLVKEVRFTSLFTFIFSPRKGTKAWNMLDEVPYKEKTKRFAELLKVQETVASERCRSMLGQTYEVFVEGRSKEGCGRLRGRTGGNVNIDFEGDKSLIGTYVKVKVTKALNWILSGETL